MDGEPFVVAAFAKVADLAAALGVTRIDKLPGCWEHQVDEHWWIAVNGHTDDRTARSPGGYDTPPIRPFHCIVEFNGWPAGIFGPGGGALAAGELANEDTFIEALEAAARRALTPTAETKG